MKKQPAKKRITKKVIIKKPLAMVKVKRGIPVVNNIEMALIPTPLTSTQIQSVLSPTPKEHIYTRPGKGGGKFNYVTGAYIKKKLNFTFGWFWDFEVKEHGEDTGLVWVLGKLTIRNPRTGNALIVKEQFGRAEVKFKKSTKEKLDFGNDLKAATTDALKKCASELGIASDVYAGNEFKDIRKVDRAYNAPNEREMVVESEVRQEVVHNATVAPKEPQEAEFEEKIGSEEVIYPCDECGEIIEDKKVIEFSKRMNKGKVLCRACQ